MANRKSMRFMAIVAVVAVIVVVLISQALQETSVYYVTVSELQAKGEEAFQVDSRINGKVVDGTIDYDARKQELRFALSDGKESMPVFYSGLAPDMFKGDQEVIVEGRMKADSVFHAQTLLAKCPSKYEAKYGSDRESSD